MRTSRLVAATLLLTWTVSLASAADSAKPTAPTSASRAIAAKAPPPMGEPVNGLACSLSANRTDFHPGECLRMSGYLFCLGKEPLLLPLKSQTCSTTVHITNPDGHEYYVEGVLQTIRPEWDVGNAPILLKSETTAFLGRSELYLTEPISNYHPTFTDSTASTVPLSLRKLGEYRFWLEFEVPFEPKSQPETWSGRLKSNVLTIKVTDLPPEKRLKEPTAEQAANLASFLAQKQRLNDFPSNDRLKEALAWTENEGLALATVNKLKELDDKADPGIRCASTWFAAPTIPGATLPIHCLLTVPICALWRSTFCRHRRRLWPMREMWGGTKIPALARSAST